jgi:hypothetical protein
MMRQGPKLETHNVVIYNDVASYGILSTLPMNSRFQDCNLHSNLQHGFFFSLCMMWQVGGYGC